MMDLARAIRPSCFVKDFSQRKFASSSLRSALWSELRVYFNKSGVIYVSHYCRVLCRDRWPLCAADRRFCLLQLLDATALHDLLPAAIRSAAIPRLPGVRDGLA